MTNWSHKRTSHYDVSSFAVAQFEGCCAEFFAWYRIALMPESATTSPRVTERFGSTLDPDEAAYILEWWRDEGEDLALALQETLYLLRKRPELDDLDVEELLDITSNTEECVQHLLTFLDESRLQDA